MRKTSVIVMFILLIAFGSMLMAANTLLTPMEDDFKMAKELAGVLRNRDMLAPDTKVFARTSRGAANPIRLSRDKETQGAVVEVHPAMDVLTKRNRLRRMAGTIAREVEGLIGSAKLDWLELAIYVADKETHRVLMLRDAEGAWQAPVPPLPEVYVPEAEFVDAPEGGAEGPK